ncbi:MAG: hypothetical protein K2X91_04195 [Thermoleophilia bacterium]|nr:hypothetical protein [Thermoleophilia bacterium]
MAAFGNAISSGIAALWAAFVRIPMRAWIAGSVVGLTWRILELVAARPALLADSSFMQLITPITGAGGFLLIVTFLFGSTKESADKSESLRENAKTMNAAGIPVGGRRADDPPPEPRPADPASDVGTMEVHAETVNVSKP